MNVKLGKWLGVPRSFNTYMYALHASSFKLSLPLKSLVEEYKAGKGRLAMMLRESKNPSIRMAVPDLNTGRKWKVEEAIREAMSRPHTEEVIGAVAGGRLEFDCEKVQWLRRECDTNRRSMVQVDEIRASEEERRVAQAVSQ